MRQLLLNNAGVKVARVPAPAARPGEVLVRVRYSMVSVGTEVATLRPAPPSESGNSVDRILAASSLASRYLKAAIANPGLAAKRVKEIGHAQWVRWVPRRPRATAPGRAVEGLRWSQVNATRFVVSQPSGLSLTTDASEFHYQARSDLIQVSSGQMVAIDLKGRLSPGVMSLGMVDAAGQRWLGLSVLSAGDLDDRFIFDPQGETEVRLVLANAQGGITRLDLDEVHVALMAEDPNGTPANEMDAVGWNLGYSAAGEVVAVGAGVTDLAPGDLVACAGAGKANHADFVAVPRNLVCRVPSGLDLQVAATTTIGTIALQGVRRAQVELGETVCVIGLGLLGQITVQLLLASGCTVIGMDLDPSRLRRALDAGMQHGAASAEALAALVRDVSGARGVDKTLMVAATKSDTVVNLAMDITRRRGAVVIVGDVGLNVQRSQFYRKEIDLLMSTSYGPGRYDPAYEESGQDYPFAYVRWTLNRNMQSYLDLSAQGRLNIGSLIDEVVPLDQAPALYDRLARSPLPPLGVLLAYPEPLSSPPQPLASTRVALRGHRRSQAGPAQAVLVGAGAYGQSMLVPMMERHPQHFFLRGLVSRDAVRGGNFVRERRLELFASELTPVLEDPGVDLLVIATRHHEHATQALAGLRAGKHVFVEKPLAVRWDELDQLVQAYQSLETPPQLMVGFNRRFSPALLRLRQILQGRRSPLIINYRLNGGYIPLDHWIQTADGAGRNIGEACHMYDVFRSLAGAPVCRIAASAIHPGDLPYARSDNFVATLGYDDGSVGNLVYTALGPKKGLPKERIEVFCDGEAYLIDDFKSLTRCSDGEVLWKSEQADKGHAEEMRLLGEAIAAGGPAVIAFDEIVETTAVALHVEDLIFGRVSDDV